MDQNPRISLASAEGPQTPDP